MIMDKFLKRIVWLIIIVPAVYLAIIWNKMPQMIATHFDINGDANKFSTKKEFLIFLRIMILVSGGIYLILTNIYRIDPKKYAADNKYRLQRLAFAVVVFMTAISLMVIYAGVHGKVRLNIRYLFALMGLLWAIVGNYMHNIKPNYFAGFRLPWTLENEDNWKKTHLLAGKLWFAGGLLITIICLIVPQKFVLLIWFIILAPMVFVPTIYSYVLYKKQKAFNSKKQ